MHPMQLQLFFTKQLLKEVNLEKSLETILEEYKDIVRAKSDLYFIIGGDKDDIIQEGMIGLVKAYNSFDEEKGASFKTYASLCIERQIINAIQCAGRKKNLPLNAAVEIPEDKSAGPLSNPEDAAIYRDFWDSVKSNKDKVFSASEHEVLLKLMQGKNYKEIAEEINKTPKQIDNTIQRVKAKLIKLLNQ